MIEQLGKLGPHEECELELLLSGEKPIALFYDLLPIEFLEHLEQGTLSMLSNLKAVRFYGQALSDLRAESPLVIFQYITQVHLNLLKVHFYRSA